MPDPDHVISNAEALLRRVSPEGRERARRARERRQRQMLKVVGRMAIAAVAIIVAAGALGLFLPIGPLGFGAALLAILVAWGVILWSSHEPEVTSETIVKSDLAQLPGRTGVWLEQQRPALPAPAMRLVDEIGVKLEGLGAQLAGLNPAEPAAIEVRKLVGEELPELVSGYRRVPERLRREAGSGGTTPDKQLVEGLTTVSSEIDRMTAQLASGDLDKLATQGRFLELKYRGDELSQ